MTWLEVFLYALLILLSIILIGIVLIQRGRGGGLIGALGGAGSSSPFGSRAGDAFTRVTLILAAIWIFFSCLIIWVQERPEPQTRTAITRGE
ncbi:MAG: preprotein translocase subunit SecG [Gemmataceae bacterium]